MESAIKIGMGIIFVLVVWSIVTGFVFLVPAGHAGIVFNRFEGINLIQRDGTLWFLYLSLQL
jgi:hypothetical protein